MNVTENTRYVAFDSLTAMEEFTNKNFWDHESADRGWVGRALPNYDKAVEASRSVWNEGIAMADDMYNKLKEAIQIELKSAKRQVVFSSDDGDDVDYDRLMSGQQEFWRQSKRDDTQGPTTVTICIHTSTPSSWDAKDAMWRGIVAVVIAEILEEAGHSVEIIAVGSNDFAQRTISHVRLKGCSDPTDRSSLINALSSWYHRTVRLTSLFTIQGRNNCNLPIVPLLPADLDVITPDFNRMLISGIKSFDGAVQLAKAEIERIAENI